MAIIGVLRKVTSCILFSRRVVVSTLMFDKQVIPIGATNVKVNVAFTAGYLLRTFMWIY